MEYPDVKFAEAGNFFNIAGSSPDFAQISLPSYYGIDQNEKKFRGDYSSHIEVYINDEDTLYMERSYTSYGLPEEYGRFRKEFWDLIIGYTWLPDWRFELEEWAKENLYEKYPYMLDEDQDREIRYFSFLESFGGKESALAVSLVYDRGEQSIRYEVHSPGKTYSINKKGQPVLYCGRQFVSWKKVDAKKEALNVPEELTEIISRYEVGSWETAPEGTISVRQGEFYNTENAKLVKDKNEQALRSRYDTLIHVVYTNGEHIEIQMGNEHLPETYNDFRNVLWDSMISYINKDCTEIEVVSDWRDFIDQWGKEVMYIKYPYMK